MFRPLEHRILELVVGALPPAPPRAQLVFLGPPPLVYEDDLYDEDFAEGFLEPGGAAPRVGAEPPAPPAFDEVPDAALRGPPPLADRPRRACPICHDPPGPWARVAVFGGCGHWICGACARGGGERWRNTCAICRAEAPCVPVVADEFIKLFLEEAAAAASVPASPGAAR